MNHSDFANAMSASSLENTFKQAHALVELKRPEQALIKFRSVCETIQNVLITNPSANVELHLVPLSLTKISDIYKDREDYDKALAFMQCARRFLEYIQANKPNKEDEPSDDGCDRMEYTLGGLFSEMRKCFEKEDAPPKPTPEEIVKMFQEAKQKREEEIAKENMKKLKEALEAKKERLRTSRWARFLEYINNHPIGIAVGAVIFLGIFLIFSLIIFNTTPEDDAMKSINRARKEANANSKRAGHHSVPLNYDKKKGGKNPPPPHNTYDAKAEQEKLRKLMESFDFMGEKEQEKATATDAKEENTKSKHDDPSFANEL